MHMYVDIHVGIALLDLVQISYKYLYDPVV
jgi:hypothetical protein